MAKSLTIRLAEDFKQSVVSEFNLLYSFSNSEGFNESEEVLSFFKKRFEFLVKILPYNTIKNVLERKSPAKTF